ncbi:thyrotropin-releasing hormone receptor-like [Gigantopelta aegis]|uniref:thyrotropin-releasing hormone receptor-like n=1 Tax=Gigantopelta aegis TaxID=1735272 RepID=UPI001B88A4A7|nr:thyrotropin-releasing hormone receptor-like [Gigantopelta aegis]
MEGLCQEDGMMMAVLEINFTEHNASNCETKANSTGVSLCQEFYAYFTPFILVIGLTGNLLSLRVFMTRNMRKLSASIYLAALSLSDIFALLFYVVLEWLRRGMPSISEGFLPHFLETRGICQLSLYLSYISRFLSAWFVVTFTVERYIGVCHPLRRKDLCGSRSAQKAIGSIAVIGLCLMVYKPIISGVYHVGPTRISRCTFDPDFRFLSFVLDNIFAVFITLVPIVIISVLNTMIIRKLCQRYRVHRRSQRSSVSVDSVIRLEFTIIPLVVSFVFVMLNLPFFCVWIKLFLLSETVSTSHVVHNITGLHDALLVTRVIFYMNYCVNFFLYSITGAYFRRELCTLFVFWNKRR